MIPKPLPLPAGRTFLVGDIGGTRTRLAIFKPNSKVPLSEAVIPSQDHASFNDIVIPFLAASTAPRPVTAVFGIAGPVRDGAATVTNLPWKLEERALAKLLRISRVVLVNDLVVGARGCLTMTPTSLVSLTEGALPVKKGAHLGVIAAGTGLGEARLLWVEGRYVALPTEGGHCDFAPRTPLETELLHFLLARYPGHVSYERIVSGAGLGNIYDFFASRGKPAPASVRRRLEEGDRNAAISQLGLDREHEPAAQAVDLFASLYGAQAGNIALRELAVGGVYVVGNIAKQIVPARRDLFMQGFRQKGRFEALLSTIPVAVVTDPLVGLRGALAIARDMIEED